ncbi:PR-1-like protein [Microthyrium microscopicum]|uniref:PR-1-like protein n=1 Tax=Microthyrium microscopicum TaxID=703497 RepID=A0A6A6UF87_9PEZI|nr:PR-1-like protein [Microthyrium microscopicum]
MLSLPISLLALFIAVLPSLIRALPTVSDINSNQTALHTFYVNKHNDYRARHGVPPLEFDVNLVNYAYEHASRCRFEHSNGPFGENLALGYSSLDSAINDWYREIRNYNYGNPGFAMNTGHFTQVIWRNSRRIGCAVVNCGQGPLLTCEYDPPGNYLGMFRDNVPPAF